VEDEDSMDGIFENKSAVVVGPGLGMREWGKFLLVKVLKCGLLTLVDADALNLIAINPFMKDMIDDTFILTPHPGEGGRLLKTSGGQIQSDRFKATIDLYKEFGCVVVMKGAGSIVFDGDCFWVCREGNPGMAVAGMGDVLSGVIGGLLAQGVGNRLASKAGVWVHASSGDLSVEKSGEIGVMATDLIPFIREQINHLVVIDD